MLPARAQQELTKLCNALGISEDASFYDACMAADSLDKALTLKKARTEYGDYFVGRTPGKPRLSAHEIKKALKAALK